jgi:hypothetical protein
MRRGTATAGGSHLARSPNKVCLHILKTLRKTGTLFLALLQVALVENVRHHIQFERLPPTSAALDG